MIDTLTCRVFVPSGVDKEIQEPAYCQSDEDLQGSHGHWPHPDVIKVEFFQSWRNKYLNICACVSLRGGCERFQFDTTPSPIVIHPSIQPTNQPILHPSKFTSSRARLPVLEWCLRWLIFHEKYGTNKQECTTRPTLSHTQAEAENPPWPHSWPITQSPVITQPWTTQ